MICVFGRICLCQKLFSSVEATLKKATTGQRLERLILSFSFNWKLPQGLWCAQIDTRWCPLSSALRSTLLVHFRTLFTHAPEQCKVNNGNYEYQCSWQGLPYTLILCPFCKVQKLSTDWTCGSGGWKFKAPSIQPCHKINFFDISCYNMILIYHMTPNFCHTL